MWKKQHMDSPAVLSDSYVIIKKDYDSNNAYVLKDLLDMGGRGAIKLPLSSYRISRLCGLHCTHHNIGYFSKQ